MAGLPGRCHGWGSGDRVSRRNLLARAVGDHRLPGRVAGPPPLVGQDTRAVLRELGHRDPEIDALIADGVCYEPDDHYAERFTN